MTCCFCRSDQLSVKYKGMINRFNKISHPIDIYTCRHCRSLVTLPLPSGEELAALYGSYEGGMSPKIRDLRNNNPLHAWHHQCITRATRLLTSVPGNPSSFSWLDAGAGGGELARMMALRFPNSQGVAVDFNERPEALDGISNVTWVAADLNEMFSRKINQRFDLVMSITVIEHVLSPENLLHNCNHLLRKDGGLYITAPCADTPAQQLLGKRWPYMIPGEHLNIPSVKGMSLLLRRIQEERAGSIFSRKTILPYTLGYFLSFFRLSFVRAVVPHSLPVKLPTGILEAGFPSRGNPQR